MITDTIKTLDIDTANIAVRMLNMKLTATMIIMYTIIVNRTIPIYLPHPRLEMLSIICLKSNAFFKLSCAIILFNAMIRRKNAIMKSNTEIMAKTGNAEDSLQPLFL